MAISRRSFLAGAIAAASAAVAPARRTEAAEGEPIGRLPDGEQYATLIDLTRCDGCPDQGTPACVSACRTVNAHKFPEPDPMYLKDYWPQPKHEDWSKKRHLTDRLTPYNWTFVQKVEVDGQPVSIPRRCMHCDNPPCSNLCPFGVMKKTPEGPVYVDESVCFGGAKCRVACPWSVPQRQAGVGIYTHLDPLPVGGGVVFKCDLCRERLAEGKHPGCVEACPKGAIQLGVRSEIYARAEALAKEYGGHIYGKNENGGASTLYFSKLPFEAIDAALVAQAEAKRAQQKDPKKRKKIKVMRMHAVDNIVESHSGLAAAALAAPLIGIAGAFAASVSRAEAKQLKEDARDG